ncbi:MAG: hypothetical protein AB7G65_19350 [Thermoleophilia bacterium]
MNTTVSWGPASIIGYLAAAAAAITPMIGELADNLEPLGVPAQTWVVVSAILAAVTTVGRMYQAGQQAGAVITEPIPEEGGFGEPDA